LKKSVTKKKAAPKKRARKRVKSAEPVQQSLLPDTNLQLENEILDSRLLMPQKVVALAMGISVQAFQKWRLKWRMKRGRENLYYLPDVVQYRFEREDPTALNLGSERARLASAQANKAEMEVKVMEGELIPADAVLSNWEPIVGAARAKILGIKSKIKTAIPKLNERDLKKVDTICRGALEDLANNGIPASKKHRPEKRV